MNSNEITILRLFGGNFTNKLYSWDLYDKRKLNMNRLYSTRNEAWVTSGYVIAESIEDAKLKLADSFDFDSGNYILNFNLGEKYIKSYYVQDDKNENVFIEEFLLEEESGRSVQNIKNSPISYNFVINVTIQSIEKDGEKYLQKLMKHFLENNFNIINGKYERKTTSHDRLGNHNPYHWDIIEVKLNLERLVNGIHSPTDYIDNILHDDIYKVYNLFRTDVFPNDNKLDYISWINESWHGVYE